MASLHKDDRTGNWIIMFRWAGKQFRRSCETKNKKEAGGVKARVEDTIRLLKLGRIEIPNGADPALWIMSDGKLTSKPRRSSDRPHRLGEVCDGYLADQLAKAHNTVACEKTDAALIKQPFIFLSE